MRRKNLQTKMMQKRLPEKKIRKHPKTRQMKQMMQMKFRMKQRLRHLMEPKSQSTPMCMQD